MSDSHTPRDRPLQGARRIAARLRPGHIAVVAVLAVIGVGIGLARTMALPGPQPILDGDRMKIRVVAPVEPEVAPGSVMEVGDLVEGFEYRPLPRPEPEPAAWAPYDEEPMPSDPRPAPRRYDSRADLATSPPPDAPEEDGPDSRAGRWFGFDAPQRDYRAEREARRARTEARMERDRERREVRWYRSDGQPVGDGERDDRPGSPAG
jgi:hypothetical protein